MLTEDCIYPDCQIKGEWLGTACEHSCPVERAAADLWRAAPPEHGRNLNQWRPIETAPDPPTGVILLYCPGEGVTAGYRAMEPAGWLGWHGDYLIKPTHWMPLPE